MSMADRAPRIRSAGLPPRTRWGATWRLAFAACLAWLCGWMPAWAADAPLLLTVSVSGPRNLSFLPVDLISRIGADRNEGAEVRVRYVEGGSAALQQLSQRNVDFAVAGVPAMLSQYARGQKVTILAAVDDLPLYVLLARADLRKEVRSVADLKGRVIGVTSSSLTSRTTSEQLAELLLASAGVATDQIRLLPAGQGWREQSSALISGTVDALVSFEPVATRLQSEKLAYPLASLADPEVAARIPGAGFLLAALATRPDIMALETRKAEKMVAVLRRSLQWIASHTPEQVVDALAVQDARERAALLGALRKYRRLYSPDGRLSGRQLQETETFFQKSQERTPSPRLLSLESLVDDRWAGRRE